MNQLIQRMVAQTFLTALLVSLVQVDGQAMSSEKTLMQAWTAAKRIAKSSETTTPGMLSAIVLFSTAPGDRSLLNADKALSDRSRNAILQHPLLEHKKVPSR